MKRKLILLACVAALVCSMFTACSLTQAQSITFAEQPQSVFVVDDTVDINSLIKVEVTMTDGSIRTDVPVRIDGFSTAKAGAFTATVTYRGVSVSFTYYVMASLDADFIAGSGTQEDPYLIANAAQLANIGKYTGSYHYFKVADGIKEIDCTGYKNRYINGSFDGNGVVLTNLTETLFTANSFEKVELKNFSVKDCDITSHSFYHNAVLLIYAAKNTTLSNINISGKVAGSVAASFIAYGPGSNVGAWECRIENCISDATLISWTENSAGFIAHPLPFSGTKWYIINSYYTGQMMAKSGYRYFANNNDGKGGLYLKYDSGEVPDEITIPSGWEETQAEGYTKHYTSVSVCEATYTAEGKTHSLADKSEAPSTVTVAWGESPEVEAAEGAVRATAYFVVGPNKPDGKENYVANYMQEELALEGRSFRTGSIKYWKVTINGTSTSTTGITADGKTFNIVNGFYGDTYGSCYVQFIQYDKYDNIVRINTVNLPDPSNTQV